MVLAISRSAFLCLLLLCGTQARAGAQLAPRPLPQALAVRGGASGVLAAASGAAAGWGFAYAAHERADAAEAGKFIGETAFGAAGSLAGGFAGAFGAAFAVGSCPGDGWVCTDTYVVLAALGVGSTLGSALLARAGNDVFGGRSSLRGSLVGGLAGMVVGGVLAAGLSSDPTVDDLAAPVVYAVTQGAFAAAGGRLFARER